MTDEPTSTRRTFLKTIGATAALTATGATDLASAADYRTITVPTGQKKNLAVGSGETLANVLIDMTATGASAQITTSGSNWTIRNVGFKGEHPGGHYLITPGVASTNGMGTIEHVYLGDGQAAGTDSGGVWVNANLPHRGTLNVKRIHVAHMIDNGFYGSGPGAQGYGGVTHFEDSYFYGNNIANIRCNSKRETSYVRNCTVKVDGSTRPCRIGCSSPGAVNDRGVWSWYGRTHIVDSDIQGALTTAKGGSVTTKNTRTGSNADTTPPAGVPMTAEEAARGTSSSPNGAKPDGGEQPAQTPDTNTSEPRDPQVQPAESPTETAPTRHDPVQSEDNEPDAGGCQIGVQPGSRHDLEWWMTRHNGCDRGLWSLFK